MNEEYYLMWLLSVKGMSSARARLLWEHFESAENIWKCDKQALRKIPSIPSSIVDNILSARNEDTFYELIENLDKQNFRFISIDNDEYPRLLKTIPDPPLGLFIDGKLPDDSIPKVAVIGSRACSEYGLTVAGSMSEELAANGVVIVSGMARGIDGMAHKSAIKGGGYTIAVLGNGIDICYPADHFALKKEITENGCVISEFSLGTKPEKYNFPLRNRIISGLSDIVVVVEAERRSGTSITVEYALNQGRDVMAVPGSIYNKYSEGTNNLIWLGATPATCAGDVLFELGKNYTYLKNGVKSKEVKNGEEKIKPALAFEENLVYACISLEPIQIDELLNKVELTIQQLQFVLVNLEINGYIRRLPGQRYIRAM